MSGLAGPADLVPDLFLAGLDRGHGAIMAGLWRVYPDLEPSPGYFINYISCPGESHQYHQIIWNV